MSPALRRLAPALLVAACGDDGSTTTDTDTSTSTETETTAEATTGTTDDGTTDATDTNTGTTGEPSCADGGPCPVAVLMGYWPPTNEMLRPWSTNPEQNPDGWQGKDWRGLGYDVYAFFPEFPPDGDPSNDMIGDPGAVGSPESDLRVDYQDTSADFWRIVDRFEPVILITTSRGSMIGWELEAVEGGHGDPGSRDPASDWISDGFPPETHPTMTSIEPRSWQAISQHRQGATLDSGLPMAEIAAAVSALGLGPSVEIDATGTSGNFLSGFLGLHGLFYYYHESGDHGLAAGHIHVGRTVTVADARAMIEETLEVVLELYPPP